MYSNAACRQRDELGNWIGTCMQCMDPVRYQVPGTLRYGQLPKPNITTSCRNGTPYNDYFGNCVCNPPYGDWFEISFQQFISQTGCPQCPNPD